MAEAFLQVLLDNLSSLIKRDIGLIVGADSEMKKLSSILTTIQAVLEDAEDRQFESKPIQNWLSKLNSLAFEIDDLLDECGIEVSKLEKKNNKFHSLKKILLQRKIGRRMKEMTEKLDGVASEREKFHFRETSYERQTGVVATRAIRETGSVLNEPNHVYGREEEKEKVVDLLVNDVKDSQQLSIVPIIGLGGLGKTTLAQMVYNDQRITEHFELKMWVCVSDDFDLKTLIQSMIQSATRSGSASDLMNLDALECRLWELLNNKRYLLILDDVWNENQEKWAKLEKVLACGARGASIVVTTRLRKVADIMGTLPVHCLSGMLEEHCWLLFKKCAFGQQEEQLPSLEAIGREIVKKCGGVPLAAKALGGLLRFKRTETEWIYVKESELWKLEQEETSILPSLRLSYRHLPLMLRRCFAYCALFPKDTEIEKEELIFLWMAHGCISSNGQTEVEDIGRAIQIELVVRSLLQLEVSGSRKKTILKMHDLVHDLALSIMESQVPGPHANNSPTASNNKIREVHMNDDFIFLPTSIQLRVSTFTSLMSFSRLRMLTTRWTNKEALPSSLGKLKQLRSLNLSGSFIQTLPNTEKPKIRNLVLKWEGDNASELREMMDIMVLESLKPHPNIETLMISGFKGKTFPLWMGNSTMNSVVEIDIGNCPNCLHLPPLALLPQLKKLKLRQVDMIEFVGEYEVQGGYPFPSLEKLDLRYLPNLKGLLKKELREMFPVLQDLRIYKCPSLRLPPLPSIKEFDVDMCSHSILSSFSALHSLTSLSLQFNKNTCIPSEALESLSNLKNLTILEAHKHFMPVESIRCLKSLTRLEINMREAIRCPPGEWFQQLSTLKTLIIFQCDIIEVPSEIKYLHSLELLGLVRLQKMVCLPESLQHLPHLQSLLLHRLHELTSLPDWLDKLFSLKALVIWGCQKIESIPSCIREMTNLFGLRIHDCPELARQCEKVNGEDWYKIAHIRKLYID